MSTAVPDPCELLWGHVAKGALVALQLVLSIFDSRRGKTKVSNFNIEVLIEKNVLRLEVPMAYSYLVVNVGNETEDLLEKVSSSGLGELAGVGNYVKELAFLGVLHENIENFLRVLNFTSKSQNIDNVGVTNV